MNVEVLKMIHRTKSLQIGLLFTIVVFGNIVIAAQNRGNTGTAKRPTIFAVLNDGKQIEPIAHIEKGKLIETINGSDAENVKAEFVRTYYPKNFSYNLIFGGANAGTANIVLADHKRECASNLADIAVKSTKVNPKGHLMALATNAPISKTAKAFRRMPTWPERDEIDVMIRAEFAKNKYELKKLDYHNLTALDVDGDGKLEYVGSFWAVNDETSRLLFFFIAQKNEENKLEAAYKEFRLIKAEEVMNGEIELLDKGIYHELLLDVFDYDNDGVAEIFTYVQAFEGSSFNVYRRSEGEWINAFEGSNYRCAF